MTTKVISLRKGISGSTLIMRLSCLRIPTMLMPYLRRRPSSISVLPSHSSLTSSSMTETSSESSAISTNPALSRFFASRTPDSCSGKVTSSAPILSSMRWCRGLAHLTMTRLTPASLQSIVAMTLDSRLLAMAMITASISAIPSWRIASGLVTSAHLQCGMLFATALTTSGSISMASTSAPFCKSSLATALPYLPRPMTAYDFFFAIINLSTQR